jgi:aminoglycoside phosphotransferase (APT) family kinase protein
LSYSQSEIRNSLSGFYAGRFPSWGNIEVLDVTEISDGWENEVYSFTIGYGEGSERTHEDLILRVYPGGHASQKAAREFNGMRTLHKFGFPVPEVLILELDNSLFGKPFVIMERIHGQLMQPVFERSSDEEKSKLIDLFFRMFVHLHSLDWRPFAPDPSVYQAGDPYTFIKRQLSDWREYIDRFRKSEFAPVLDWLEERYLDVPCEQLSVIHFDYHPNNILLRDDGKAFVIDWTNIGIADFRIDIAWTIVLMSTYGSPEAREIILGEYERIAGHRVKQIQYFEVAASLRRLFSISVSISSGADKLGMRPEAVTAMKRNVGHIKNVYSLLYDRTGIAIPEMEELLSDAS